MCVCMYVCMGIRRKSYDVLPATGPSWFPPLATMLKGEKRRRNDRGRNDREGWSDGAEWKRVSRSSSWLEISLSTWQ